MEDIINYSEYIAKLAIKTNKELKNNINYSLDNIIRVLLLDYIKDTMDNYDYRNCPLYDPNEITGPIFSEENFESIITEDSQFIFITELEEVIITESVEFGSNFDYIEVEDSEDYIALEYDHKRYEADKQYIEDFLKKLIKDKICLQ